MKRFAAHRLAAAAVVLAGIFLAAAFPATGVAYTTVVQVNAINATPTDTDIPLSAGEHVVVTATATNVTCHAGNNNGCGSPSIATPDGSPSTGAATNPGFTAPLLRAFALIGRLDDGAWFFVGSGPTRIDGPGRLRLMYNDSAYPNNAGFFTATITGQAIETAAVSSSPSSVPAGRSVIAFGDLAVRAPLGATTATTIASSPLRSSPLRSSPLRSSPLRSSPLRSSPLRSSALGPILLTDVPLRSSSWEDLLAGTPLNGPVNALTLDDVFSLDPLPEALRALTLADIDLEHSPLRSSSLGAILLGQVTLDHLAPPTGGFCALLGKQSGCDLSHETLLSAELTGADLDSFYAAPIALNGAGIDVSKSTLATIRLDDINLAATPLAGRSDLGPYTTVGDVLAALPLPGLPVLTLGDLVPGLVAPDDLPFELAPLDDLLAAAPLRDHDLVTYDVAATIHCTWTGSLEFAATLPHGARYVPNTARARFTNVTDQSITLDDPTDVSSTTLSFDAHAALEPACAPGSPTATITLTFQVEPPARLGPMTLDTVVKADGGERLDASGAAAVEDSPDPGDTAATAAPLAPDTLRTGYVSSATDVDAYTIHAPPVGSIVTVVLSQLPADYDLTVTGPPVGVQAAPLRSSPLRSSPLRSSPLLDGSDERLSTSTPQTLQDVPLRSSDLEQTPLRSSSINRSDAPESASFTVAESDAGKDFTVRVSGYNGAQSVDPYVLRMEVVQPPQPPPCRAPRQLAPKPRGAFPALPLPAATKTLFLVNEERMAQLYPTADVAALRRQLDALAARPEVAGKIIPVESDPAHDTDAAYSAWDAEPCSVEKADAVGQDILALLTHAEVGLDALRNVVIVGGDEVIPQLRVPDLTSVANEREESAELNFGAHENAVSSSLRQGFMLSDDGYGDADPQAWAGGVTFVPDMAVGRLVESPAQIAAQLTQYTSSNGRLSTASAQVAGYDFLSDGATAIADGLRPLVPAGQLGTRIDETWTANDALAMFNRPTPGITSVNAHFDQYRALPAAAFNGGVPDLVRSASVTPAPGALVFTAGCHAGLNIEDRGAPDARATDAPRLLDWTEQMARNKAVYVANTTYGYGDTEAVAYTERLLALLAQNVGAQQVTAGQALMLAKQRYAAEQAVPGVYDAKVSQGLTFYGLPFYRIGASGKEGPSMLPPEPSGSTERLASSFVATPSNVAEHTARGTFWQADGQAPQVTHFRPIQPRTEIDVTSTDGRPVHGAVVEELTMTEEANVDPVYSRPTTDLAAAEPEIAGSDAVFPAAIQRTSRTATATGLRDLLILASGQFEATAPSGVGVQRLFSRIAGTVYRSNSADYDPPTLTDVSGEVTDGVATFRAKTAASDMSRGIVLFRDDGAPLRWKVATMTSIGGGVWQGSALATAGASLVEAFTVQFVDTAGNVGISTNKGPGFVAPGQSLGAGEPRFVLDPARPANGFHRGPVTISIDKRDSAGAQFDVIVDDGAPRPYSGPFTVSGDGAHTVRFTASDGASGNTVVKIDSTPPAVTAVRSPAPTPEGWNDGPVTVTWSCADAFSGIATCPPAIVVTHEGANQSAVSEAAADIAGNTATGVANGISIDLTAPTLTISRPLRLLQLTGAAADALSGVRGVAVSYTRLLSEEVVTRTATVTCTAADRRECRWTAAPPPLGIWRVDATVTDRAGRTASASARGIGLGLP